MSGITWLASYPKSGNTWMRIFLTNYWRDADAPADINDLDETPIASSRAIFDEVLGVDSTDLTPDEIDRLRPAVYKAYLMDRQGEASFNKIHDAYITLPDGQPMFPVEVTARAIYIARNPLDVAHSFANHGARPIEWAVRALCNPNQALESGRGGPGMQLHQPLLTWSGHVESWLNATGFPIHLVRYEDMTADPLAAFTEVVRFIGAEADSDAAQERIKKAIRFSEFDELKRQELERGFKEKMMRSPAFFNQGQSGAWRHKLTPEQVAALLDAHAPVMRRLGYLAADGALLC